MVLASAAGGSQYEDITRPTAAPPPTNRGVENTSEHERSPSGLGLGWFQGTYRGDPAVVVGLLSGRFGPGTVQPYGSQHYSERTEWPGRGVVVMWGPRSESNARDEVFVQLKQAACDELGWHGCVGLVAVLVDGLGFRASRADVYSDDRARVVEPAGVYDALLRGDVVTHARATRLISGAAVGDAVVSGDGCRDAEVFGRHVERSGAPVAPWGRGSTVYIGSPQSDVQLRVYDKAAESGILGAGVRWELEARGDRARSLVGQVVRAEAPAVAFMEVLDGYASFRQRGEVAEGRRRPVLAWWGVLLAGAGTARLAVAQRVDTLARRLRWLGRQVAPSLALAYLRDGEVALRELVAAGASRLTGPQLAWVAAGG